MSRPVYPSEAGERRQEERVPRNVALVYAKSDEKGCLCCMANSETVDMSSFGCCLRIHHDLALSDLLKMELMLHWGEREEVSGEITWLKKDIAGARLAGIKFSSPIDGSLILSQNGPLTFIP